METKGKKILKILLWVVIVCIVLRSGKSFFEEFSNYKLRKELSSGMRLKEAEEYKNIWENTMSDIEGMTMWDKYEAGLAVNDNSDTDGDGLTDKEEIEDYLSNPLKISTSDDLYTDLYKIEHGMDINTYYEYKENKNYIYNECEEIIFEATVPTDFNAVAVDCVGKDTLNGCKVYKQYEIYNYAGNVAIDVSDVLNESGLNISELEVYASDGRKLKKYSYTYEGNIITLKKRFDMESSYKVFLVKKSFWNRTAITFSGISSIEEKGEDVMGAGLVVDFPILTMLVHAPVKIFYEDLGNENDNLILKEKINEHARTGLGDEDEYYDEDYMEAVPRYKISAMYETLKRIVPIFDVSETSDGDFTLWQVLFMYYDYEKRLEFENAENLKINNENNSTSNFNISEDTLPFGNFKSEIGTEGNCAGISHFTAYLYNTGEFEEKDSYCEGDIDINWDLTTDPENSTLRDKGLSDYKTETFVNEHSEDGKTLIQNLSDGEQEFVKMIGASYLEGNSRVNHLYQSIYGGENAKMCFDYSLIDAIKTKLEEEKILDVYLKMYNGIGHTVNIFGYEEDPSDPNVTWFLVYDNNFSNADISKYKLSENGFKIKVNKKVDLDGKGYVFSYEYHPLADIEYGANSNKNILEDPFILVMDENWNDINPAFEYAGCSKDFEFHYVSTADIENDYTAVCHYKDSYFYNSSIWEGGDEESANNKNGYNVSLSTASQCFAMSCFGSNEGGKEDYSNKYKNVKEFLNNAEFDKFDCNDWFKVKPQSDSIGVAAGSKKISVREDDEMKEYTLIAVAVRGGGYESEWASNFTLGNEGQHHGFADAKKQVLEFIREYISENDISGDIKVWLVGFSRAGATANLVAGAIDDGESFGDQVSLAKQDLYAYCFEPPIGAYVDEIKDQSQYRNIYNIVNVNDPVTKIAMEAFGFRRYGLTYFLPEVNIDGENYNAKKDNMLKFYKNLDSYAALEKVLEDKKEEAYPVDNFKMKKGLVTDTNIIIQELVGNKYTQAIYLDDTIDKLTKKVIKTRENYVETYQNIIRNAFTKIVYKYTPDASKEQYEEFLELLEKKLLSKEFLTGYISAVPKKILDESFHFNAAENASLEYVEAVVYSVADEVGINKLAILNSIDLLSDSIYLLLEGVFELGVSNVITFLENFHKMGAAHYPELCLAWLMSQDPTYISEPLEFDGNGNYRIAKFNCPIDVLVYDSTGEVVALIEDDQPQDVGVNGIIASVNEDGEKVVYLPANAEYEIKLTATDVGTMNVSVNEFSATVGSVVRLQNYCDISVKKGDVFTLSIPQYTEVDFQADEKSSSVQYSLSIEDKEIAHTEIFKDDEIVEQSYTVKVESADVSVGTVIGNGIHYRGDFAAILASPKEGYHFTGWFKDGKLVSSEKEYRFMVEEDVTLVAYFVEGADSTEAGVTQPMDWTWFLAVCGACSITIIAVLYLKKSNKI